MNRLRGAFVRVLGMFSRDRRAQAFAEEIESHLQMHIDDNVRSGMTRDQARREAILKLGGVESTKEAYFDRATLPVLDHLALDVRFAVRQLVKNPGFSLTATMMLALGFCASLAIFGFVDAALIKPLPYRNPGTLMHVTESTEQIPRANLSYLDYLDWKRANTVFTALEAYNGRAYLLSTPAGVQIAPAPGSVTASSGSLESPQSSAAISSRERTCRARQGRSSSATLHGRHDSAEKRTP